MNLLSVSQLTKDLGYRVAFDGDSCVIQDHTKGLTIGQGEEILNLYVLDRASLGASTPIQSHFYTNIVVDATLWHHRLGHPSIKKLDCIANVLGLSQRNKMPSHCAICPLSKQKHFPFISHNNMCTEAFELLHIDTWGPFSVPSVEGYKYFLTIVDDHTRVTWVYLLRTKDEVLRVFPELITMVETQYKAKVRGVRSDNAKELMFTELYNAKGIRSFHSCPETPQQNSVVERKHQHILNVARALMFQAKLSLQFWSDCVLTAVFLINQLPSPLLQDKSPYQLLHKKKPDYSEIRVFGCLCYVSTSSKNRHKFQPRSRPSLFLGYPAGFKGYKVIDLDTNVISVSRNIVFHEDIFPFICPEADLHHDLYPNTEHVVVDKTHTVSESVPVSVNTEHTVENEESVVDSQIPTVLKKTNKRSSKQPAYLEDYYCNMTATDIPYPLAAHLSYEKLTECYKAYVCAVTKHVEPTSFNQAKKFDEWIKAMNEELIALESTYTWEVCSLPDGKRAIGCKWVYKVKLNADGTLERYKARLVANGYTQQEGIDFVDTFSPVAKMTTVKTLLAVSAAKRWSLTQLDISNAFLNGDLTEEIYMSIPPGYTPKEGATLPPNPVCRLKKSLYGLKQASRQWFLKFSATLISLGFKPSHSDHTLFISNVKGRYVAVLVYVDDIGIASNNDEAVDQLKENLKKSFKLRDLDLFDTSLVLRLREHNKESQFLSASTSSSCLMKLVFLLANLLRYQWIQALSSVLRMASLFLMIRVYIGDWLGR